MLFGLENNALPSQALKIFEKRLDNNPLFVIIDLFVKSVRCDIGGRSGSGTRSHSIFFHLGIADTDIVYAAYRFNMRVWRNWQTR